MKIGILPFGPIPYPYHAGSVYAGYLPDLVTTDYLIKLFDMWVEMWQHWPQLWPGSESTITFNDFWMR